MGGFVACAEGAGRGGLGHQGGWGDAVTLGLERQRVSGVSSGSSDDAALCLLGQKLGEGVVRAAFLEAAGALEVVEFAENLHPGELAQRDRLGTGRLVNGALDALGRGFDIGESDQKTAA